MTPHENPGPGHAGPENGEEERPPLSAFLERSPGRLLVEAALGCAGGAALAATLPQAEGPTGVYIAVGAVSAPLALLLTPLRGSVAYRGVRYGLALAVVVTLIFSFIAGSDGLTLEELLALLILLFGVGAVGHAAVALTLDRDESESETVDRWPPDA
jgi:hypothetical protein